MWIRDFHAIDLHKDKVVKLFCQDACVELLYCFSDRGGFASTRHTGDVDACTGAGGDCGFEVRVYGGELLLATGK